MKFTEQWYEERAKRGIHYSDVFARDGLRPMSWTEAIREWMRAPRHFGMANVYSDEWTKVRAGRRVAPYVYGGKPRIIKWDFASLAANTVGDIFVCGKIYKGDMVIRGRTFFSALTSAGGTASGSYGAYTVQNDGLTPLAASDVDRYLAATSMESAGQAELATLQGSTQGVGTGPLHVAAADLLLVCVNSGEAFATAGRLSGWLLVVRD